MTDTVMAAAKAAARQILIGCMDTLGSNARHTIVVRIG
jgi:hypothetical protein